MNEKYKGRLWTNKKGQVRPIYELNNGYLNQLAKWLKDNKPDSLIRRWVQEEIERRIEKKANFMKGEQP